MRLFEALNRIAEGIKQQRHLIKNEAETVQVSVYPFIQALGYNPFSLNDVKPQYTADPRPSGGERVDYALMREGKPVILIEAKSVNTTLTQNHWRQLHDYFNAEEIRIGILTNGLKYQIYSDLKKRNIMDNEPFLTLEMLRLDSRKVAMLEEFKKTRFNLEHILYSARKAKILRILASEFEAPSDGLVKHFAQLISSSELTKKEVYDYAPIVKEAMHEFSDKFLSNMNSTHCYSAMLVEEETSSYPTESSEAGGKTSTSGLRPTVEIPVQGDFLGVEYRAILLFNPLSRDGDTYSMSLTKIQWKDVVVSVNDAEYFAIREINPEIKQHKWKGWDTWKLVDPNTGNLRAIRDLLKFSELRERFFVPPNATSALHPAS